MEWQQVLIDSFEGVLRGLEKALDGLSLAELNQQPRHDCNSMAWLAWHLTRTEDRAIAGLIDNNQVWIKDEWYKKFNRPADPQDTGFGHKPEDVAAFKSPDVGILLGYHKVVLERSKRYLANLSVEELGRKIQHPVFPTVEATLVAVISDTLQHLGQIAYIHGLLKGKGWMPI